MIPDALRLAKEATNGWACYAKRDVEHREIARLHQAIQTLAEQAAVEARAPHLSPEDAKHSCPRCEMDRLDCVCPEPEARVPRPERTDDMRLRPATESVGWLNSEGPLSVSPTNPPPVEARVPHEPPAVMPSIREHVKRMYEAGASTPEVREWLIQSLEAQEARPAPPIEIVLEMRAAGHHNRSCDAMTRSALVGWADRLDAWWNEQSEAQASRPAPPLDWQPIATAPKGSWPDGPQDIRDPSYVEPPRLWLTLQDGLRCVGYFDAYYAEGGNAYDGEPPWVEVFSGERIRPTHWMPLPDPPAAVPQAAPQESK